MELASLVGVPRTTINDWLGKYSLYISAVQQGKRKVYPESSLAVLKEIAQFRNEGFSFPEIGEKLAENHPVHPEVAVKVNCHFRKPLLLLLLLPLPHWKMRKKFFPFPPIMGRNRFRKRAAITAMVRNPAACLC